MPHQKQETSVVPTPTQDVVVNTTTTTVTTCDRPDGWHVRRTVTDSVDEAGKQVHEVLTDGVRDIVADKETGAMVHERVTKGVRDTIEKDDTRMHVVIVDRERDDEAHHKHEALHASYSGIDAANYHATEAVEDYKCVQEELVPADKIVERIAEIEAKAFPASDAPPAVADVPAGKQ